MGNIFSRPLQGETPSPRFSLLKYFTHRLARVWETWLPVRDRESPFVHRPQDLRVGTPDSNQDPDQVDDSAPQVGKGLISTQDLEDIRFQQHLPLTLPRFRFPRPSVDRELDQMLQRIKIADSCTADHPDHLPGPEETPVSKETPGLEGPQYKKRDRWSWESRPSAFKPLIRNGVATPFVPKPGKLTRRPLVVEECLELCPICTRVHGRPTHKSPDVDLRLKEDDAVPGPSDRRGLVCSPLGPLPSSQTALGKSKSVQGAVGRSTSVQGSQGPSKKAKAGVIPVHSHEGGPRSSSSSQWGPTHSINIKTRQRHAQSEQGALRPSPSLKRRPRRSPSPKRGHKRSQPNKLTVTHAASEKRDLSTSPVEQEGLKHSPPTKRYRTDTIQHPGSLTTPTSTEGIKEHSTSTKGVLGNVPSAHRVVEKSTIPGTLGPLPSTQRDPCLPTTAQGAEGFSVSFQGPVVLPVASQWSFTPFPSHGDDVTGSPSHNGGPMHSSKGRLRHAPSEQQGFKHSSRVQEGLKHSPSAKRDPTHTDTPQGSLTLPTSDQGDLGPSTSTNLYFLQQLPFSQGDMDSSSNESGCVGPLPSTQRDPCLPTTAQGAEGFSVSFQGPVVLPVASQWSFTPFPSHGDNDTTRSSSHHEGPIRPSQMRHRHGPSEQQGFKHSSRVQEGLKHSPSAKRDPTHTDTPQGSLTLPTSDQGDLVPSTSTNLHFLQYLPFAQGDMESSSNESGSVGPLPSTQRDLSLSTTAQGAEGFSVSFEGPVVLPEDSQWNFSPFPYHDHNVTGSPAHSGGPMRSSQGRLRHAPLNNMVSNIPQKSKRV